MTALVIHNARVLTGNPQAPHARSVRIEGGQITHTGDNLANVTGQRMDMQGAVVLAGLIDSHFHLHSLGEETEQLDLSGTRSEDELVARVQAGVQNLPEGAWLFGRGWDDGMWQAPPSSRLCEQISERAIYLMRKDGHAVWVNKNVLSRLALPDHILGGEVGRDSAGTPTGILVDNAMALVQHLVPKPSRVDLERQLLRAVRRCEQVGLTHVHDMGMTPEVLSVLQDLEAAGRLNVRVTCYLYGTSKELAHYLATPPMRQGLVRVVGLKLFVDGALGSRGAALSEPYCDCPQAHGLLLASREELLHRAQDAHARGYQVAVHAIGDRANTLALDILSEAQQGDSSRRHRIEHAQIVRPQDRSRFARHGIIASMQPTHATGDMPWALERLGPQRLAWSYAWRELMDAGVHVALGSDAPVEHENPWWGVYAATTRHKRDGSAIAGFANHNCLTLAQALNGFTRAAAFAAHDTDLGMIAQGMRADLTVIDADPHATPIQALHQVGTVGTFVEGRPSDSLLPTAF